MKKFGFLVVILGAYGSSLMADTTFAFLNAQNTQTLDSFDGYYISPYSGKTELTTTGGKVTDTPVQLFCDDFVDHAYFGSNWQVALTNVQSTNVTNSRFGGAGENTTYPSGTALYEQVAWLFTQEVSGQTAANIDQIQEAVWLMTAPKGTSTPTGAGLANINNWISAAQSYYLGTASTTPDSYQVADYSKWTVVTDVNTFGAVTGSSGPGTSSTQEFLAYTPSGGVPGKGFGSVPEPASFLLFGTGLAAVGLVRRRKLSPAKTK